MHLRRRFAKRGVHRQRTESSRAPGQIGPGTVLRGLPGYSETCEPRAVHAPPGLANATSPGVSGSTGERGDAERKRPGDHRYRRRVRVRRLPQQFIRTSTTPTGVEGGASSAVEDEEASEDVSLLTKVKRRREVVARKEREREDK